MYRRRVTPSFVRRPSQCAFAVRDVTPSLAAISSFEQPSAISWTTCRWRSVNLVGGYVVAMAGSFQPSRSLPIRLAT